MKRISVKNMSEELYILETIVGWKSATLLKKRFLQKWVFSSQMILLRFSIQLILIICLVTGS